MSQYYPQQNYPPRPAQNPEDEYEDADYEYEEDEGGSRSSLLQLSLAFVAGGCLVFLCLGFCGAVAGGLWYLDPSLMAATPPPGIELGLSFEEPAYADEAVVNDKLLQLTILDVNRAASVPAIPPVPGREVIVVTIELVNLGEEETSFNERDFNLLNVAEDVYPVALGAIEGSLGRGDLPPQEGLEGRLVFEVAAGEPDLQLLWQPKDSEPRYIYLE